MPGALPVGHVDGISRLNELRRQRHLVSILTVGLSYGDRNVLSYTRHMMQNFLAFRDSPIIPLRRSPTLSLSLSRLIVTNLETKQTMMYEWDILLWVRAFTKIAFTNICSRSDDGYAEGEFELCIEGTGD